MPRFERPMLSFSSGSSRRPARKARRAKAPKGGRGANRRPQGKAGSQRTSGVSIVKSPSMVVPDRLFCPMKWTTLFANPLGGTTDANYTGMDHYYLEWFGDPGGSPGIPNTNPYVDMNTNEYHMYSYLSNLYSMVRIWSSSIKIDLQNQFFTNDEQQQIPYAVSVTAVPTNSAKVTPTDFESMTQQPFTRYLTYGLTKTGNKPLFNKASMAKIYGISKQQLKNDPSYYSTTAAPTEAIRAQWLIGIYDVSHLIPTNAKIPADTFVGTIQITTHFEFFSRVTTFAENV